MLTPVMWALTVPLALKTFTDVVLGGARANDAEH